MNKSRNILVLEKAILAILYFAPLFIWRGNDPLLSLSLCRLDLLIFIVTLILHFSFVHLRPMRKGSGFGKQILLFTSLQVLNFLNIPIPIGDEASYIGACTTEVLPQTFIQGKIIFILMNSMVVIMGLVPIVIPILYYLVMSVIFSLIRKQSNTNGSNK